jgi:hypothetical protein
VGSFGTSAGRGYCENTADFHVGAGGLAAATVALSSTLLVVVLVLVLLVLLGFTSRAKLLPSTHNCCSSPVALHRGGTLIDASAQRVGKMSTASTKSSL